MVGLWKILAMSAVGLAVLAGFVLPEGMPVAVLCAGAAALAYAETGGVKAESWRIPLILFACLVFLALAGFADYVSGYEASVVCFYLLPIMVVAWMLSWGWTVAFTALAAVMWVANQWLTRGNVPGAEVVWWNAAVQTVIFYLVAGITARLHLHRRQTEELRRAVAEQTAARRAADLKVQQLVSGAPAPGPPTTFVAGRST